MSGPLEGLRVLDLGTRIAAPFCAGLLGEMGAEVVKVEQPGRGDFMREIGPFMDTDEGESYSLFWAVEGRGRKSITLDLKVPGAVEVVRRIVPTVDVVTENFRPGVMERLGLGYDDLRQVNPAIVYVSGSGFGSDGPYARRPGQDLLIQAMSGLAAHGGRRGDPPTPCGSAPVPASSLAPCRTATTTASTP